MGKINIEDGSGDKDFFTMIPNIIKNHSTANDQSLYLQMKGFAGEDGKCFATEKTLMARMGVGKRAFDKSLNYLLEKKWIKFVGITEGKTRPIKTYRIENIWELNTEHYKKISAESNISFTRDKSQKEGDKCQKQHKISVKSTIEEEPRKEDLEKELFPKGNSETESIKEEVKSYGNTDVNFLLTSLKEKNGGFIDGSEKENRQYCWLLLQKLKYKEDKERAVATVNQIIEASQESPFHSKMSTSFKYLYYNFVKIASEKKNKRTLIKL